LPAVLELQETIAVPGLVRLLGVKVPHVSPEGSVSPRLTLPVNPLRNATVMVEPRFVSTFASEGELAVMVKSWTVYVIVVL
jgi:hypothetical protein